MNAPGIRGSRGVKLILFGTQNTDRRLAESLRLNNTSKIFSSRPGPSQQLRASIAEFSNSPASPGRNRGHFEVTADFSIQLGRGFCPRWLQMFREMPQGLARSPGGAALSSRSVSFCLAAPSEPSQGNLSWSSPRKFWNILQSLRQQKRRPPFAAGSLELAFLRSRRTGIPLCVSPSAGWETEP